MNLRKSFEKLVVCSVLLVSNLLIVAVANNEVNSDLYDLGVGIADITGQAADVGMVINF